jgi:PKD domain
MNPRAILTLPSVVLLIATLWACGDGNPLPTKNTTPIANLTSSDTVKVGVPLSVDGSNSSDADGDPLTHSWDFGDGVRGGTAKIAHVYASSGSFKLKLTVGDGKGGFSSAEKTITVTPGETSSKSVNTLAIVTDLAGAPMSGVTLSIAETTATTGADGRGSIATPVGIPVTLQFSKSGYADQFKALELPETAESGYLEVKLMPREANQTLPNASNGGAVTGKESAKVTLPANALVDSSGNAVTGAVQVAITPVDVVKNIGGFPGKFEGVNSSGQAGLIVSYGTTEYVFSKGNERLNLAPGQAATIEIPIYTALNPDGSSVKVGDSYPMWSLDERTGGWVQEGTGVVVASSASPSGLALRGAVTHFSWWNHDDFTNPYNPKPKCLIDSNLDGVAEDLTGTGYCWHGGTGPEQPPKVATIPVARQQASSQLFPVYAVEATTPASGGVVLPIPANMNVTLHSFAKNGTLAGTKVLRGAAGVTEDVNIVLYPVVAGGSCSATPKLNIPHDAPYTINQNGQTQCYSFDAPTTGSSFVVRVSRNTSSNLTGSVTVIKPDGSKTKVDFGTKTGSILLNPASGTYQIEVNALSNAPGAYRLEVVDLGATLVLDTDVSGIKDPTKPDVYNFYGVKGQKISLGYTFSQSFWVGAGSTFASLQLFAPSGFPMNSLVSQIITLPETGLYSLEMTATTGFAVPYKLRVNSVVDASPLTLLEPITELNLTLALGEHKRFALTPSLSQGEVLAVRIAIAPTSHVGAVVNDGSIFNICGATIEGQYPFNGVNSSIGQVCYVTSSGTYYLEVYSENRFTERIGGSIKIGILKPTPQPIGFDTVLNGNLEPLQMLSYRLNVATQTRYLLRGTFADSFLVGATVWGPSAPYENYRGDLIVTDDTEQDRVLRVGTNTLTILNRHSDNPKPYNVSIVTLEPPFEITVGAAPLNGIIDIAGEKDYYRFNAATGQNFTITASSGGSLVGTLRVYPLPAQNEFTGGANITPFNPPKALGNYNFVTPSTGTYAIEIDGTSAATGAYSLALTSP